MKIIANGIGCVGAFLLGMLIASYYPLPGINVGGLQNPSIQELECPVGFATFEEMKILVEELRICEESNENR